MSLRPIRLPLLAALFCFTPTASGVTIDWVTVGDPGNATDTAVMGDGTTGYGSVGYVYRISKHEITNAQYAEFLNAVAKTDTYLLYSLKMGNPISLGGITRSGSPGSYTYRPIAGREHCPVNYVSFYDALRFANWLHNGQPWGAQDGTITEDGAYTFTGHVNAGSRNAGAAVFLTSEDEWYKAAYYDSASASYFRYPAVSDAAPTCAAPGATPNTANCDGVMDGGWGFATEAGAYTGSASPSGTFDQGGNAFEWNEAIIGSSRGVRGGSYRHAPGWLRSSARHRFISHELDDFGFRVASIPDPTPACDDGFDNDGDGAIDFDPSTFTDPGDENTLADGWGDSGCHGPSWHTENPQCQDGVSNDPGQDPDPGLIDFDGGLSILGAGHPDHTAPDPQCVGAPWKDKERMGCGLGAELTLLLPLIWLPRRAGSRSA
jgi:hypothetical protein